MHIFKSDLMYGSGTKDHLYPKNLLAGQQLHRFSSLQQKSKGLQLRNKLTMAKMQKSEKVMDLKSRDH